MAQQQPPGFFVSSPTLAAGCPAAPAPYPTLMPYDCTHQKNSSRIGRTW